MNRSQFTVALSLTVCAFIGCGSGATDRDPASDAVIDAAGDEAVDAFAPLQLQESVEASDFDTVDAIAFSPDGETLVTGGDDPRLWKLGAASPWHVFDITPFAGLSTRCHAVAFSPDGALLALGASDGSLVLFDLKAKRQRHFPNLHQAGIASVHFLPHGANLKQSTLAASSFDGVIKLVRVEDSAAQQTSQASQDSPSLKTLTTIHTGDDRAVRIDFTPDGNQLISVGREAVTWETTTGKRIGALGAANQRLTRVDAVAVSPDGQLIATASVERSSAVRLWAAETRTVSRTLNHPLPVFRMAFSPNGKYLATCGMDHKAYVWRVADGELLQTIEEKETHSINGLSWHPKKRLLALDCNGTIQFWR